MAGAIKAAPQGSHIAGGRHSAPATALPRDQCPGSGAACPGIRGKLSRIPGQAA